MAGRTSAFTIDTKALVVASARYRSMGPAWNRVLVRTVNWTGERARTTTVRRLAQAMGLNQKELRYFLQIQPASSTQIVYTIRGTGRPLSLRAFGAVQRQKGVSARPWGTRRIFRGTFIIASLGGSVYKRTGTKSRATKGRYKGKMREDIEKLWGPSVPMSMADQVVTKAFQDTVTKQFPPRLDHEIARALAKLSPS